MSQFFFLSPPHFVCSGLDLRSTPYFWAICLISFLIYRFSFTFYSCNLLVEETGSFCPIVFATFWLLLIISPCLICSSVLFISYKLVVRSTELLRLKLIFGKNTVYMLICISYCIILGNMECLTVFFVTRLTVESGLIHPLLNYSHQLFI